MQPIYVNWAPLSVMKTPDRSTKFCKKALQKAGTYTPRHVRTPLPRVPLHHLCMQLSTIKQMCCIAVLKFISYIIKLCPTSNMNVTS